MHTAEYGPGWTGEATLDVAALHRVAGERDIGVSVNRGWDLDWELHGLAESARLGRGHLSVRYVADEVQIGPLWFTPGETGCGVCAEYRGRIAVDHPLVDRLGEPTAGVRLPTPLLDELLGAQLAAEPLRAGELLAISPHGIRRHVIRRSLYCPCCVTETAGTAARLTLRARPTGVVPPTRSRTEGIALDSATLRAGLVDSRFGPVRGLIREVDTPFAMAAALLPDTANMGYGRATTFGTAETVAILEVYERFGGYPYRREIIHAPFAEVAEQAMDPAGFGGYTTAQLERAGSTLLPYNEVTPIDWVWGNRLHDGAPVLVPAEIGFYRYQPAHGLNYHAGRRYPTSGRTKYFEESSSGCALGSTVEEATLHSLLELAERDAFLMSWYRGESLPCIDKATVHDELCLRLLDFIDIAGFEAHLLVATWDLGVPVVWGLAINRERRFPVAYSAAGSAVDPIGALRAMLWELAQQVGQPATETEQESVALIEDPWQIRTIEDHVLRYLSPSTLPVTERYLGGPKVALDQAFPGWPDRLTDVAGSDVLGALRYVADCYRQAGLGDIAIVVQSTVEHRDIGLSVVKAAVPGIIPMCFGTARQRLRGLPRLAAAGIDVNRPLEPHPFP